MKNLKLALTLVIATLFTTSAFAGSTFISDFRTGTSMSKTTGTVKITGTSDSLKRVNVSGNVGSYDIRVNPCTDCGKNTSDDYSVIGNLTKVDRVHTDINRLQTLDITNNATICETEVDLGGLRATYGSERYTSVEKVTVDVNDVSTSSGREVYTADVYKGGHKVGSILNRDTYNQTSVSDLQTVQVKEVTGRRISSYIGG